MSSPLLAGAEWLPLLGELAAKATLVLLLAAAASALLWRSSAAVRHMVWCVGVLCVLALPLLSAALPAWTLPVLPAPAAAAPAAQAAGIPDAIVAAAHPAAAPPAGAAWLPGLAAALAAGGALAGMLWLAGGFWGVARLGRRAEVIRDPEWLRTAQDAADRLRLRRPVLLLRSRGAHMPATWGLLWPSVVLPSTADGWTDDRRRAVLAHELAHVKRFDCLTQALAQVACVLLWWHPAVWYAARRLRVERERACDDLVLAAGARASDYATHLLEIAGAHRGMRLAAPALVSMAKPSQLESRLLWVLDGARARSVPSARATLLTALAGLLVAAPLSALRPVEAASPGAMVAPRPAPALRSAPAVAAPLDEVMAMRGAGVDAAFAAEMRAAGYGGLTGGQLVRMKSTGVSARYAAEMNGAGWGRLTAEQLVSLASVGMRAEYVRGLRREGLADLSVEQATRLKAVGVTPAYAAGMRSAGLGPLDAAALADLKRVGITAEYVRELAAAGLGPLTPDRLVRARADGDGAPPPAARP
ncbi:MAG TPA: M56 family metallopeptidase [Longimicrobiaceae bacterium]|jgi:beta-lactamase regulating signal transducer with metallopeptidase domain